MNLLRFPPGKERFLAVAVLSGAVIAGTIGFYALGFAAVRRDARVLAGVRQELARREAEQQNVIAAGRTLQRLERERSLIAAGFADPAEPLEFIETVERLARRFGSRAQLRLVGDESRADAYAIAVEGPLGGVLSFLESLEALSYLTEFGEADLVRGGGAGASTVRLNIGLSLVPAPSPR